MKAMQSEEFFKVVPKFMRDFHDQKDLFKAIHALYSKNEDNKIPGNWVDNHIFTIDFFLWFMAQHGYRLQKFKSKKFQQFDIHETIEHFNNERRRIVMSTLKAAEK